MHPTLHPTLHGSSPLGACPPAPLPNLPGRTSLLAVRIRLLLVYLILPIVFMFFEVALDRHSSWFNTLWRQGLELYLLIAIASRVPPTPEIYQVYFRDIQPQQPDGQDPPRSLYLATFRYLLGSRINAARADEAVAAAHARRQERRRR